MKSGTMGYYGEVHGTLHNVFILGAGFVESYTSTGSTAVNVDLVKNHADYCVQLLDFSADLLDVDMIDLINFSTQTVTVTLGSNTAYYKFVAINQNEEIWTSINFSHPAPPEGTEYTFVACLIFWDVNNDSDMQKVSVTNPTWKFGNSAFTWLYPPIPSIEAGYIGGAG